MVSFVKETGREAGPVLARLRQGEAMRLLFIIKTASRGPYLTFVILSAFRRCYKRDRFENRLIHR